MNTNIFTVCILLIASLLGLETAADNFRSFVWGKLNDELGNWLESHDADRLTIPPLEYSFSNEFYSIRFSASNLVITDIGKSVVTFWVANDMLEGKMNIQVEFEKDIGISLNGSYHLQGTAFDFIPIAGSDVFSVKGVANAGPRFPHCDLPTAGFSFANGYIDSSGAGVWSADFYTFPDPSYNFTAGGFEQWILENVIKDKVKEHVSQHSLCSFLKGPLRDYLKYLFDTTSVREIISSGYDTSFNA